MAVFPRQHGRLGLLTYMIVGGTRANIIIAFAIFLLIGIIRGWISLWMLAAAGVLGIVWHVLAGAKTLWNECERR